MGLDWIGCMLMGSGGLVLESGCMDTGDDKAGHTAHYIDDEMTDTMARGRLNVNYYKYVYALDTLA